MKCPCSNYPSDTRVRETGFWKLLKLKSQCIVRKDCSFNKYEIIISLAVPFIQWNESSMSAKIYTNQNIAHFYILFRNCNMVISVRFRKYISPLWWTSIILQVNLFNFKIVNWQFSINWNILTYTGTTEKHCQVLNTLLSNTVKYWAHYPTTLTTTDWIHRSIEEY